MSEQAQKPVTLLPVSAFLLELHSERMIDAMHALNEAGFVVMHVKGTTNRFRIDDAKENTP
jgi:predicted RNA binding protein YcfA (HicA-like mRNA interferase family)